MTPDLNGLLRRSLKAHVGFTDGNYSISITCQQMPPDFKMCCKCAFNVRCLVIGQIDGVRAASHKKPCFSVTNRIAFFYTSVKELTFLQKQRKLFVHCIVWDKEYESRLWLYLGALQHNFPHVGLLQTRMRRIITRLQKQHSKRTLFGYLPWIKI